MLNLAVITGRLARDPIVKELESGAVVASFTLAVQGMKDDVDWIPVEVWNKTAESVQTYVKQGSLITVEGSIKVSQYETADGPRTFTKVVGNRVHFVALKPAEENPQGN